jgi:hypothetical protein
VPFGWRSARRTSEAEREAIACSQATFDAVTNTLSFKQTGGNLAAASFSLSLTGDKLVGTFDVDISATLTTASKVKLAIASILNSFNTGTTSYFNGVCTKLSTPL